MTDGHGVECVNSTSIIVIGGINQIDEDILSVEIISDNKTILVISLIWRSILQTILWFSHLQ